MSEHGWTNRSTQQLAPVISSLATICPSSRTATRCNRCVPDAVTFAAALEQHKADGSGIPPTAGAAPDQCCSGGKSTSDPEALR